MIDICDFVLEQVDNYFFCVTAEENVYDAVADFVTIVGKKVCNYVDLVVGGGGVTHC